MPGRSPLRLASPDSHSHLELVREAVGALHPDGIHKCVFPSALSSCCWEASQSHPQQT